MAHHRDHAAAPAPASYWTAAMFVGIDVDVPPPPAAEAAHLIGRDLPRDGLDTGDASP